MSQVRSQAFFPDWEDNADDIVATLRTYAGQNPHDKKLTDLIDELVTRSDTFRPMGQARRTPPSCRAQTYPPSARR